MSKTRSSPFVQLEIGPADLLHLLANDPKMVWLDSSSDLDTNPKSSADKGHSTHRYEYDEQTEDEHFLSRG